MNTTTGSSHPSGQTSHMSTFNGSNVSVRYPGASTPITGGSSPVLPENTRVKFINSRKDKMNLPVGPLAEEIMELMSSTKAHEASILLGRGKNFNVTGREERRRRDRDKNADGDGTLSFSPISDNGNRNLVKFTVPRKGRPVTASSSVSFLDSSVMSGVGRTAKKRSKASSKSSAGIFPYPDLLENMCPMEPGEMLFRSLKTLEMWKRSMAEQQRLAVPAATRGKRKEKEQAESSESFYEFTPDMFAAVNTDAFVEVMYLVLSCYDQKETDSRFRDCWPVYEMKMVSAFRRVCLEWMKQIVKEHPEFFRDLKIEAISGLIVNPGGDRFISMMRQFCRLTMFKVASSLKGLVKKSVLLPPCPSPDSEITNRQMHALACKTHCLVNDAIETHCEGLEDEEMLEERLETLDRISEVFLDEDDECSVDVEEFIFQNPEIFADDLLELSESESSPTNANVYTLSSDGTIKFENPILVRLESLLKARVNEIYTPVSLVENVIQDYEKIWYILEMDRSNFPVLDLNKIDSEWVKDEQGEPSLHKLIANITKSVHEIVNDGFLSRDTPSACLSEFNKFRLRINFLEVLEEKVKKQNTRGELPTHAIEIGKQLKRQYEGFDWSYLSGVHESEFSKCFDMSPMRVLDLNNRTGRTPHMTTFLDASLTVNRFDPSLILRQPRRHGSLGLASQMSGLKSSFRKSVDSSGTPRSSNVSSTTTSSPSSSHLPNHLKSHRNMNLNASDNISSPLSSQPGRKNSALLFDVSDVWDTSLKSSSMRKSVSFLDTIVDVSPSDEVASASVNNPTLEPYSAPSTPLATTRTPDKQSSSLNSSPSLDDSLIEASVKERVKRLLESAALPDSFNESTKTIEPEAEDQDRCDGQVDSNMSKQADPSPEDDENELSKLLSSFENISYTQDWADMKGIMETSHIELALNSDSDE